MCSVDLFWPRTLYAVFGVVLFMIKLGLSISLAWLPVVWEKYLIIIIIFDHSNNEVDVNNNY